jgi:outer membrane protein assembly complex protein YaeT
MLRLFQSAVWLLIPVWSQRCYWLYVALTCGCVFVGTLAFSAPAEPAPKIQPAKLKISGYGLFGNRELKRILKTVELGGRVPDYLEPNFVEDAALLLISRIKRDGYLKPVVMVKLETVDNQTINVRADDLIEHPLPRPLRVKRAEFHVEEGIRYFFRTVQIEGLQAIKQKTALSYFVETDTLLRLRGNRVYTTNRLSSGMSNLSDFLSRRGYAEASVELTRLEQDDSGGAVDVGIQVREGPRFIVESAREEFYFEDATFPNETTNVFPRRPYSRLWLQDFTLSLKTNVYHRGYPDATVSTRILNDQRGQKEVRIDLLATINSGPRIWIGDLRFKGNKRTSTSLISRRVRVERGEVLDRIQVEQGRTRLAQLGAFTAVDVTYPVVNDHTRDVVYELHEAKALNLSLLFGWGSYELARGGLLVEAINLWGRAHQVRLQAVQSIKSSRGDFTYTIPLFLGREIDLFVHGSGLRREEIDFTRVEYGGGFGFHKLFNRAATDLSVRYNYGILNAFDTFPAIESEGLVSPAVGSIITDLKLDRRDNPLYPRRGYKLFTTFETASQHLGGDADYERIELSPSWHVGLGGGRFLSLGVSHGAAISFGAVAEHLPFNKRFFPGGDHSIRGYQEGEASPRNEEGKIVGAETYTLATVELEQALTRQWSLVLFSDSLGFAHRLEDYPFDTGLFSVGGGIRWRTVIGPIRLEYGHNLNPRPRDPSGTLHFSIGYPL